MVRSILLRGFDQEIAEMIGTYMKSHGTKFIRPAVPTKMEKTEGGKILVHFQEGNVNKTEEYDTVLFAIGRNPDTSNLGCDAAGLQRTSAGKFNVVNERTNVPHIYAIGDVVNGTPELTPVAIKAGKLLADRLFAKSNQLMDYINIPTVVFTPLEYGCCGLSEEAANEQYSKENVETFLSHYKPTYWTVAEREDNVCFVKLVCLKPDLKVVGFHVFGVEVGEITQGIGIAMK